MKFARLLVLLVAGSHFAFAQKRADEKEGAKKANWTAQLIRTEPAKRISGLEFPLEQLPVFIKAKEEQMRPLVELIFFYEGPEDEIRVFGQKPKKGKLPNQYYIVAFLLSKVSTIQFSLKTKPPNEGVQAEEVLLMAPEAQEFQIMTSWASYFISLGYGLFTYKQSFFGLFSSQSGVLSFRMDSPEQDDFLGWSLEGLLTAVTFSSDPVPASPQFLNARAGITLRVPIQENTPWRHQIGFYASSLALFANGSQFGFSTLLAPEIGWNTRYYENSRNSYGVHVRFALLENYSFDKQRTLNLGLSWLQSPPGARMREWSIRYLHSLHTLSGQRVEPSLLAFQLGWSF